jgi:glyoxylase-like metal-dependent hydrolase (beta-lactamase superfamily II)
MATGLAGCATGAANPAARALAPGVLQVDLGGVLATAVSDGSLQRPVAEGFVRNASVAQVQAALRDAGLPTDQITFPYIPLLIETGGRRILIDAGNGEFSAPTTGKLLENLAKAGVAADSIDAVVFSHLHGDDINGLRNRAGALMFPKAQVYVPTPEWNWWMDDQRMSALPEAQQAAFRNVRRVFGPIAQQVRRFEPGVEVLPGLQSMPAFGHTAGHTAFVVPGRSGRKLLFWADASNVDALFVRNPDWAVQFDADPEAARQTRRRLADLAIRENMLLAGYHLSGSGIGRLAVRGSGYEFTPLSA